MAGNFRQEKIFANFATCSSSLVKFLSTNFLSFVNVLHREYGNLCHIGKGLFHQIFLQYKGSWA